MPLRKPDTAALRECMDHLSETGDINGYDDFVDEVNVYEDIFLYPALGLAGETGEVLEHYKKHTRSGDAEFSDERREKVIKELGDVLWYVTACAHQHGVTLTDIMIENMEKLIERNS